MLLWRNGIHSLSLSTKLSTIEFARICLLEKKKKKRAFFIFPPLDVFVMLYWDDKYLEQFVDYYIYHNYLLMKGFKGPNPYLILGVYLNDKVKYLIYGIHLIVNNFQSINGPLWLLRSYILVPYNYHLLLHTLRF